MSAIDKYNKAFNNWETRDLSIESLREFRDQILKQKITVHEPVMIVAPWVIEETARYYDKPEIEVTGPDVQNFMWELSGYKFEVRTTNMYRHMWE